MLSWLCIFYFEKCVTQSIKVPFENKVADPTSPELWSLCLSFSFSLSLSSFFRQIPWNTEALWVHFFARASKTRSRGRSASPPNWEGALRLRPIKRAPEASMNRTSPVSGTLLAFCVNQGTSASFSLPYSFSLFLFWPRTTRSQSIIRPVSSLSRQRRPSWGYPRILLGLDPGIP